LNPCGAAAFGDTPSGRATTRCEKHRAWPGFAAPQLSTVRNEAAAAAGLAATATNPISGSAATPTHRRLMAPLPFAVSPTALEPAQPPWIPQFVDTRP
jgi:hypothetical protein